MEKEKIYKYKSLNSNQNQNKNINGCKFISTPRTTQKNFWYLDKLRMFYQSR